MKLYDPFTTLVLAVAFVAVVFQLFNAEQNVNCTGVALFNKDLIINCEPESNREEAN